MQTISTATFWFFALVITGVGFPAQAHQTGKSTFVAHVKPADRTVDTVVTFPCVDLADHLGLDTDEDGTFSAAELTAGRDALVEYLDRTISVEADGEACSPTERRVSPLSPAQPLTYMRAFECPSLDERVTLRNAAMVEMTTGYTHFGRIQIGDDTEVLTTAFNKAFPTFEVALSDGEEAPDDLFDLILRFVWQGLIHIALGLDHVLFVVALVMISRDFRHLIGVVTAFTLSHSVTLGLAALGVVTLPASIVEPFIAASIVYVAAEGWFREKEPRYIYLTTFTLGLLHGFGFSYVLADVGLPKEAALPALFSFNIGVELGQLAIVLALWPLRRWTLDKDWERTSTRVVLGVIGVIAAYWLVTRVWSVIG